MASKQEMAIMIQAVKLGMIRRDQVQQCLDIQREKGGDLLDIVVHAGCMNREHIRFIMDRAAERVGGGDPVGGRKNPIPGFRLLDRIGQGGMAVIYLAEDAEGGKVALKIMRPAHTRNKRFLKAFVQEARLMTQLEHPNLIKGFQAAKSGDLVFLVMEYFPGRAVQRMLDRDGPLPESLALHIVTQIAEALDYLARQGLTHRDVKPDNILMAEDGGVKLCDLGFAKSIRSETEGGETTSGTVQYMSPEQARGRGDLDVRSDIYSLGATLYHLVVGKVPFSGKTEMHIMASQVRAELNADDVKTRTVSSHMHYFIEKMMAKDRDIRYQSPRAFLDDVRAQMAAQKHLQFRPDDLPGSVQTGKAAPASLTKQPAARRSPRLRRISARRRRTSRA